MGLYTDNGKEDEDHDIIVCSGIHVWHLGERTPAFRRTPSVQMMWEVQLACAVLSSGGLVLNGSMDPNGAI